MLHWLQQKLLNKNLLFTDFCIASTIMHLFFGCALFCMYKGYDASLTLHVHASKTASDVIVRLLPLTAKKPVQKKGGKQGKIVTVGQQKRAVKKSLSSPTQLAKIRPVVRKKPVPVKKLVQVPEQTKQLQEQSVVAKAAAVETVPSDTQTKEVVKAPELVQKTVEPVATLAAAAQQDTPGVVNGQVEDVQDNVLYVTHKELDGLQLEEALQAAVQSVWCPPAGIDSTVESEVLVRVDWDGKLLETQLIKAANIVIYDVAVQEAIQEMEFPRQVWGKEIKIAFKP